MGHGLAGNEVNDLRVWKDTLWAATTNGLSLIDLKTIQSSRHVTADISHVQYQLGDSTVIQDLAGSVHNRSHHVVLPSEARQFSAWYVGLKARPGDIHAYRHIQRIGLLPFPWYTFHNLIQTAFSTPDTIWLGKPHYDFGHNLEAHQYMISTRVISLDGAESAEAATLTLTALPHWTETVWVWLAAITLIAFLLGRFYRMRLRYLRVETKMFQLKHQALKTQINPHFVGNSINAIQKFFYPPDPEKASEYIHLFTLLLRKTLSLAEVDFSSFEEEVAYNRDYLEMIQLRYGNQFSFQIKGAETIEPHLVFPTMILQPLLENATLHGLSETKKSVLILSFWLEQDWCCCSVSDNGPGIKISQARKQADSSARKSFGIRMLQDKTKVLNQLYPIGLEIRWKDAAETTNGCGTTVFIRFKPLKHPPIANP